MVVFSPFLVIVSPIFWLLLMLFIHSWFRTQNSENDLFNPNITFNSFGLRRHLLRQFVCWSSPPIFYWLLVLSSDNCSYHSFTLSCWYSPHFLLIVSPLFSPDCRSYWAFTFDWFLPLFSFECWLSLVFRSLPFNVIVSCTSSPFYLSLSNGVLIYEGMIYLTNSR